MSNRTELLMTPSVSVSTLKVNADTSPLKWGG